MRRILTGEIEENTEPDGRKDPNAKAFGRKGGKGRAEAMTSEWRGEIRRAAAGKRWANNNRFSSPLCLHIIQCKHKMLALYRARMR